MDISDNGNVPVSVKNTLRTIEKSPVKHESQDTSTTNDNIIIQSPADNVGDKNQSPVLHNSGFDKELDPPFHDLSNHPESDQSSFNDKPNQPESNQSGFNDESNHPRSDKFDIQRSRSDTVISSTEQIHEYGNNRVDPMKEIKDVHSDVQRNRLLLTEEHKLNRSVNPNDVRDTLYTNTNEERTNPQLAGGNYSLECNNTTNQHFIYTWLHSQISSKNTPYLPTSNRNSMGSPLYPQQLIVNKTSELERNPNRNIYNGFSLHPQQVNGNYYSEYESTSNGFDGPYLRDGGNYQMSQCDNNVTPQFRPEGNDIRYAWGNNGHNVLQNEGYDKGNFRSVAVRPMVYKSYSGSDISWNNSIPASYQGVQPKLINRIEAENQRSNAGVENVCNNFTFQSPRTALTHSQSTTSLNYQSPRANLEHSQSSDCIDILLSQTKLPFTHSTSTDPRISDKDIHMDYLRRQNTQFMMLKNATEKASFDCILLETENEELTKMITQLHSNQGPMTKEYKQLDDDIKQLLSEIQKMGIECDKRGIQVTADPPSPTDVENEATTNRNGNYSVSTNVVISAAPKPTQTPNRNKNPHYENIDFLQQKRNFPLSTDVNVARNPPPIPKRSDDEHWKCSRCTFENFLVPECELCLLPRPVKLIR